MKAPSNGFVPNTEEEVKVMNSELWHACAGPLVSVPPAGSLVVYFPQGHSEQVAASMQKETDSIPSYSNLPSKLICMLHNVILHADTETDEVYAQMTLQPVDKYDRDALIASEMALKQNPQPTEFFCKTLTASDTSTHGGFSIPRRAAEKIFPPLDFSMQPPAQEIIAKDLHGYTWTFRHIYRGQPKRHLLTTGWSVFVSSKRLFAGDSVLFIRNEKSQLLLGIRRANRQQPALASSVISSDSMHIGVLASAAHAAANNSPFTIFYNPRASPTEFVVPLAKYNKAMYTQVSLGMRFRMMFETEECGVRRYMGTVAGISDFDPMRWKNSQWRNLQVGWDESTTGERPSRVSVWEIEPVVAPFYICPPPFHMPKFTRQPDDESADMENMFNRGFPWPGDEFGMKDVSSSIFSGLNLVQWMSMQQSNQFVGSQPGFLPALVSPSALQGSLGTDDPCKLLNFQSSSVSVPNLQFSKSIQQNQMSQLQQQQLHQFSNPLNSHQQQQLQQNQTPEQQALQQQLQKQQQQPRTTFVNTNLLSPTHYPSGSSSLSHVSSNSQLQQQHLVGSNQIQQNATTIKNSIKLATLPPDIQLQLQIEQTNVVQCLQQQQQQQQIQLHETLSQRPSTIQNMSKHHLQLQLLQKLQQHQHFMSPATAQLQPQVSTQQHIAHKNEIGQHHSLSPHQMQTSQLMQSPQIPPVQMHGIHKTVADVRSQMEPIDADTLSCSTSPSTNNCQIPSSYFVNHSQQARNMLVDHSVVEPNGNLVQGLQDKSHVRIKHEIPSNKLVEPSKFNGPIADPLEASSSVTSYGLDASGIQQNLSLPNFVLDGSDIQSHPRNNLSLSNLTPNTLLSRGFDSSKELNNLLSNHNGATESSAGVISSQSLGVPSMPFKSQCSNDVVINDPTIFNGGMFPNQTQRMRTFTKVQKRGSVGRSIDVTRYKDYDELRRDLARMFGIEGQMEDPQRSEWKLVYVDHENDILLVGDDPWDEFVNCVQSIKILSSGEVQQMSLDGDLGNGLIPNQASSGTDSGNVWQGLYEDNPAASFNR